MPGLRESETGLIEMASGAAGAAVTLTIAAVPGKRHAIWGIYIKRATNGAEAVGAALTITTTNLPDSLAWIVSLAMAAGEERDDVNESYAVPVLASASGTATTIVMPDPGTTPLWSAHVVYSLVSDL